MTIFLCPHIPIPAAGKHPAPFMVSARIQPGHGEEQRMLCEACAKVETYDGRVAWIEDESCIEDCEPGAKYAVMSPPYCGNRGCDHPIEKDGYCLECWPECHLVDCTVLGCENAMPVCDAEEFYGKCSDHRSDPRSVAGY